MISSNASDAPDDSGGAVAAWSTGDGVSVLALNDSLVWSCGFDQPSDLPNTDPAIDLLAANGGPTPT